MDEYIKKHLVDILNATIEVESFFADTPKLFQNFQNDMLRQRAVERNVEIMGEAINRILKVDPMFELPKAKAIVNTFGPAHIRISANIGKKPVLAKYLWLLHIRLGSALS